MLGRLQNHGVAHEQCGYQRREGLVERIVERSHAEHHTQGSASDLADDSLLDGEPGRIAVQVFHCGEGIVDVLNGPVELLKRILERFADLPHQKSHDPVLGFDHPENEAFHMFDPIGHRQGGPQPPSVIIGGNRRIQGLKRLRFRQQRIFTDGKRFRTVVVCHPNGREHLLTRAVPDPDLTVDEIAGLNAGNIY